MLEPAIGWHRSQCLWKWGIMEEWKEQADVQRGRVMGKNQGITEKVCLNASLRKEAMERSRRGGCKWQQEEHRCVLRVCLWVGYEGEEYICPAARGGGGEDIVLEVKRGWGEIMMEKLSVPRAKQLSHADLPWWMVMEKRPALNRRGGACDAFALSTGNQWGSNQDGMERKHALSY